jgi:hypothetical protein
MTTPLESVLEQVEKAYQRQPGQYSARCPAHDDKGPSLSIRETPEGAVLLHCFAGCTVSEIAGALGLELSDLFPPRDKSGREPQRTSRVLTASQALEIIGHESLVVVMLAADMRRGVVLDNDRMDALTHAAGVINHVRESFNNHDRNTGRNQKLGNRAPQQREQEHEPAIA